jgi:ribosomal protein S21
VIVGDSEPGESAIRRFRREVMNSGHILEVSVTRHPPRATAASDPPRARRFALANGVVGVRGTRLASSASRAVLVLPTPDESIKLLHQP